MKKPITCPRCNGAGQFRIWHGAKGTAHTTYTCDQCKGAGYKVPEHD